MADGTAQQRWPQFIFRRKSAAIGIDVPGLFLDDNPGGRRSYNESLVERCADDSGHTRGTVQSVRINQGIRITGVTLVLGAD